MSPEMMEASYLELSWYLVLPYASLPLAGSDLYPFAIKKQNKTLIMSTALF